MNDPITVGFLLWNGQIGGAERFTVSLASTIERLGLARSTLVFVDDAEPVLSDQAAEGHVVRATELRLGRGGNVLLHPRHVAARLHRLGVDVLFAPVTGSVGLGIRAGGYCGALVGVEHGAMLNRASVAARRRWIQKCSLDATAGLFDGFVAVSDAMADRVREVLGREVHVVTVHNGVDTERYHPATGGRDGGHLRVGVAARLVPGKGVLEAILAVAQLRGQHEILLRIAGDGPLRGELEELARTQGISGSVEFSGMVRDMPSFWRGCDVAVHAANGLHESFCLAVAEAQASGLPAIVSRVGALPSVVAEGETGLVVEPGDIDGLARALSLYAIDEDSRVRAGAAARSRARRLFSLERAARDYVRVGLDVLERVPVTTSPRDWVDVRMVACEDTRREGDSR